MNSPQYANAFQIIRQNDAVFLYFYVDDPVSKERLIAGRIALPLPIAPFLLSKLQECVNKIPPDKLRLD